MIGNALVTPSSDRLRPPSPYRPRRPEKTILHTLVREHLETFLSHAEEQGRPLPRFVEREFRSFLDCGILARGFVRVHCRQCGKDRLVAFSCKGRGFCPSCGGRRMADTAAHLHDSILPRVPIRQWVLTFPFPLRYRLAYDAPLTATVLSLFIRVLFASLRRRARRRLATPELQCGAVTFLQRFGDALNLNVHFHTLALDGVYVQEGSNPPRFVPLPPPQNEDLEWILHRVSRRLARCLKRRGLDPEAPSSEADPLSVDDPLLAALYGASVRSRIALGRRRGQRVLRFGDGVKADDVEEGERHQSITQGGFSLNARIGVPARDRKRLEHLCRYVARPPVATTRLSRLADGRLCYRLKRRWRDGTTHVVFEPLEFLEKMAALVPPPRAHQVRYHGILGPAARDRRGVVPASPEPRTGPPAPPTDSSVPDEIPEKFTPRLTWAELMRRVFAIDVLECPRCRGRMRVVAAVRSPQSVRRILEHLKIPSRSPPLSPARRVPSDRSF